MGDPRVSMENAEEKFIRRRLSPKELRRLAASVRADAVRMEEAAARVHHRADVYEDMATEREDVSVTEVCSPPFGDARP